MARPLRPAPCLLRRRAGREHDRARPAAAPAEPRGLAAIDVNEYGGKRDGVRQQSNRRLFMQLLVFDVPAGGDADTTFADQLLMTARRVVARISRCLLVMMAGGRRRRGGGLTNVVFARQQVAGGHALSMKRKQQHRDDGYKPIHSSPSLTRLFH